MNIYLTKSGICLLMNFVIRYGSECKNERTCCIVVYFGFYGAFGFGSFENRSICIKRGFGAAYFILYKENIICSN